MLAGEVIELHFDARTGLCHAKILGKERTEQVATKDPRIQSILEIAFNAGHLVEVDYGNETPNELMSVRISTEATGTVVVKGDILGPLDLPVADMTEIRVDVHTAPRGSGGTDRNIFVFFSFTKPDGVNFNTEWLNLAPVPGSVSFEQNAWDVLWFDQHIPSGSRLTGWDLVIGGSNDRSQKWSYDRIWVYGRPSRSSPWQFYGGKDHGSGYFTVDVFRPRWPEPYITNRYHDYWLGD
jgi:hypothetical protein